ncbi:MAG: AsmA family protein [Gammaproteobacteria bacterium]|nr:AsmA family protein [Gammaproteobacteria bacterium]
MSGIIKKFFKLVAYVLLVAVVFIASVTAIFIATFDANEYKQDLADLVQKQTGRELQFSGDVSLTFYPALGMKLGALSLSNAAGFGSAPMVKVNEVSISVDVASLLVFSPEVERLVLRDLDINLQKNAKGVTNWDDLAGSKGEKPSTDAPKTESASASQPMQITGAFGGLDIQNARLLWADKQAGVEYRVNDLDLTTGRVTPNSPFPLDLHMAVQSGSEIDAIIDLDSEVHYLLDSNRLNLKDVNFKLTARGSLMPFDPLNIDMGMASVAVDPNLRSINLKSLDLALNNLSISGDINVADYSQSKMTFKLAADTLDIDELLGIPPPGSQPETVEQAEAVETDSAEDIEIRLPMELIRSLDIDGSLSIARLKLLNIWMQQLEIGLLAKQGIVDIKPLQMSLYEGKFDGAIQVNAKGKVPKYQVNEKLEGVQVGKLLTDFSGKDKISGALTSAINIRTGGEWLSELKKNSNGDISLAFSDGAIKGFNLRYLVDKAKAKISGVKPPDESAEKTDFSALSLSGKIVDGVFHSEDLNLQAPALRVGGEGKANLNNNTVDYLVKAKLVGTLKAQEAGKVDELSGLLIPVRIKGPFTEPDIDVQLDEMLKAQSDAKIAEEKARLKAQVEKEKAALQEKINEEKAALEAARQEEIEKQKAVLEAKKRAAEEKTKQKVQDKLKKLFE